MLLRGLYALTLVLSGKADSIGNASGCAQRLRGRPDRRDVSTQEELLAECSPQDGGAEDHAFAPESSWTHPTHLER